MIRASVVIFSIAGIVSITLAALGYKFFISFFSGMGVMIFGILIEVTIMNIKRKKVIRKQRRIETK